MGERKIGLIVTHAGDDPERATLPFMIANGAMTLGVKGHAATVNAEGLEPVANLIDAVLSAGHHIMVCSPCMTTRGISEADLLDGCFIGGAAKIVEAMGECSNFLSY
jgi:predicted peroxiredoxin